MANLKFKKAVSKQGNEQGINIEVAVDKTHVYLRFDKGSGKGCQSSKGNPLLASSRGWFEVEDGNFSGSLNIMDRRKNAVPA